MRYLVHYGIQTKCCKKVGYLFNPKLLLFAEELDIGFKFKKLGLK